jgi:hypothetical protein
VEDRMNRYGSIGIGIENGVWKTPKYYSATIFYHYGITGRIALNIGKTGIERSNKFIAQSWFTPFIPPERFINIHLGFWSYDQMFSHYVFAESVLSQQPKILLNRDFAQHP